MALKGKNSPVSPERLEIWERQHAALKLRIQGKTLTSIAKELGYHDASHARKAIVAAMQDTLQGPADEVRELELARLDRMTEILWPRVEKGDDFAVDRAIKVSQRRAKLLGLDAPDKVDVTGHNEIVLEVVGTSVYRVPIDTIPPDNPPDPSE